MSLTREDQIQESQESNELIEEQLLYNDVLYLPLKAMDVGHKQDINSIIKTAEEEYDTLTTEEKAAVDAHLPHIKSMVANNPELGAAKIDNFSWSDKNEDGEVDREYDAVQIVTFHRDGKNVILIRGTPDRTWIDNGKKMSGHPEDTLTYKDMNGRVWENLTPVEVMNITYVEDLLRTYGEEWAENGEIIVMGHSKGGGISQILKIMYPEYISRSISTNPAAVSPELRAELDENIGKENVEKHIEDISVLIAENDYVHGLGVPLFTPDNVTWYEPVGSKSDLVKDHYTTSAYDPSTGKLARFVDGPGPIARYISKVNELVLSLHPEERQGVVKLAMSAMQAINASWPIGEDEIDIALIVAGNIAGLNQSVNIIQKLQETKEAREIAMYLKEIGVFDTIILEWIDVIDRTFTFNKLRRDIKMWIYSKYLYLVKHTFNFAFNHSLNLGLEKLDSSYSGDRYAYVVHYKDMIKNTINLDKKELKSGIIAVNYANVDLLNTEITDIVNYIDNNIIYYTNHSVEEVNSMVWQYSIDKIDDIESEAVSKKSKLGHYSETLTQYKNLCKEVEGGFIDILNQYTG